MQKKKGFSLMELIVVIAIMSILAAIAVPQYKGYMDRARKVKALSMGEEIFGAGIWSYRQNKCIFDQLKIKQDVEETTGSELSNVEITADKNLLMLYFNSEGKNYIVEINIGSNTYEIKDRETGAIVSE